jgi:PAS domain S-box-containing protein
MMRVGGPEAAVSTPSRQNSSTRRDIVCGIQGTEGSVNAAGGRPSVVLVDDSPDVRALVRRRLEAAGFEVVGEGADGDEAIMLAHRLEPSLMLLDASMPGVDGLEALPAIGAVSPDTKVVMFTGFEEQGLAVRARELGVADLIEKSIRLEDLPGRLLRTLDAVRPGSATASRPPLRVVDDGSGAPQPTLSEEQKVLNAHVQEFRELFDRAEIGMATLTSNGTIVRANRALADLMSCQPHDLVGVDYGRLTVGQGDELDRLLENIGTLGEDLTAFEHYLPVPAGHKPIRIVRATLAPIRDERQQVLYVFVQVQDVTAQRTIEGDLRRSEETFRRLVTAVEEYAIFLLEVDGTVASWNAGAERIKGYAAHEIVGRHFRAFYPLEDQVTGHPEHNLELALREGSFAEEGWRVRKDGSRFWASVVISPVYDDVGHHVGFAKVTRDQTSQREHEEERRTFTDQRIHLLAVTAHELRNPTAVIDGSAGALRSSWDEMSVADRDELLGSIRGSAERLRRLAADLETASRMHAETLLLRLEDVSLGELLRSAAARSRASGTGVAVRVEGPGDAVLRVDPERLGQALDNLIDNAVRHGALPIGLVGSVDGELRIAVTDGGEGVPDELVPHLFEPFAVGGESAGRGLGLNLVQEVARRHGGEAVYHPRANGSPVAFELRLPQPT